MGPVPLANWAAKVGVRVGKAIWGVERSSAKMKVLGAEVALVMRSAAARGEEADFVRARKG